MSANSGELQQMVAQLAAMAPADRDAVLDLVGAEASRKLLPLLQDRSVSACSPALAALIDEVSGGAVPNGMTARAAAAIRDVAQRLGASAALPAPAPVSGQADSMIDRMLGPLIGRGKR